MSISDTPNELRQVFSPPRPIEQLPPTIPPNKGAMILCNLEQGIQGTIAAMSELGLGGQLDSIEEVLTDLERKCFTDHVDTAKILVNDTIDQQQGK